LLLRAGNGLRKLRAFVPSTVQLIHDFINTSIHFQVLPLYGFASSAVRLVCPARTPEFSFYCNYPYLYRNAHFEIQLCNGEDMGIKEIEIEIRKLDLKDRATLAKWLIDSLDELPELEDEALSGIISRRDK